MKVSMDGLRLSLLRDFNDVAKIVKGLKDKISQADFEELAEAVDCLGSDVRSLLCVYHKDSDDFTELTEHWDNLVRVNIEEDE